MGRSGVNLETRESGWAQFAREGEQSEAEADDTHIFKTFFIDQARIFFRNPSIKSYVIEALKTGASKVRQWCSPPSHSTSSGNPTFSM
jgi:hypothetical protein